MQEKKLTGYPSIDKPWLKYYSEEAINTPLPECTIYEYLWENNKEHLDDIALNYFDSKITYGELFDNIEKAARGFYSIGVREGDNVTLISANTPELIYCIYALNLLGAVSNMEYVTESAKDAQAAIERSNSKVVVILDRLLPKFNEISVSNTVEKIIALPVGTSMPFLKRTLLAIKRQKHYSHKEISFYSLLKNSENVQYQKTKYRKDAPAFIVHSGGTTGIPKGVVHSNDALNYIGWIFRNNENGSLRGDKWSCSIPAFHAFGLALGVIYPLCQGLELVMLLKCNESELIERFVKVKPNAIMVGGSQIPTLFADKRVQQMDLSFFKICGFGGSPITAAKEKELVRFFEERGSIAKICVGYGLSETCSAVCTELNRYYGKPGSVGILLSKCNVKVLDIDTEQELPYGQDGELCFSTPGMMLEYYQNEKETQATLFEDENGTRWLHSGDVGHVDEDGFVFITGRIKRIYSTRSAVTGGMFKIFPDYVASVVAEVDGVMNCAVVCIGDSVRKNVAVAFVIAQDSEDKDGLKQEILKHTKENLPEHSVPTQIVFVDAFPFTPIGKIDYRALENRAEEMSKK